MKKFFIAAFACTAAMLIACGDDSSSASSDVVESSSSIADASSSSSANDAAESSSSIAAESSSSDWAHESVGNYGCASASDTTSILWYAFEGPDSAMEVIRYVNPKLFEDVEKVCEEAKANKTDDQEVTCDGFVEITYQPKTMTFDSLKTLMTEECKVSSIMNTVDLTNPDKAPENVGGIFEYICILTKSCS